MSNTITIGGPGYNWRGRYLRGISHMSCIALPRQESIIIVPVIVRSGQKYKINIVASKNLGSGLIFTNFFGNQKNDGTHVSIKILSSDMQEYSCTLNVPQISPEIPIYFRIWKADNSGCIFVKSVKIKSIEEDNKNIQEEYVEEMKCKPYEIIDSDKPSFPSIEKWPKVSIITPTRNNIEVLRKCCEALIANTHYPNWEWIIGDSNSEDGTKEYIEGIKDDRIKLIERKTTEGSFSSINNELIKESSGDLLLFLNDDTEPQPFWLTEMVSKIERDNEIGIVGAQLVYTKDRIQHAGIAFVQDGPANISHKVLLSFHPKFASYDRYLQAVTGACLLVRKKDFEDVGGFDTVYYFCYEDVDLCLKVRKQLNKKVLYAANAVLVHSESTTQKKYKTGCPAQWEGIRIFKERWMKEVELDFEKLQKNVNKGIQDIDISFVTCVNNIQQYYDFVITSLAKNITSKRFDIIPILNINNKYSASQALNIGIDKSRSDIVVLCHQDISFPDKWIDMLCERIKEIETTTRSWGVLGTAGITAQDDTVGVVYNTKGRMEWHSTRKERVFSVQTLDEHCLIIRKSSNLRFDEQNFNGFHFYGVDLALESLNKGFKNFGILCPLIHASSGSLKSGKKEFMRLLNAVAKKWENRFRIIRTPTSIIRKGKQTTFINFRE